MSIHIAPKAWPSGSARSRVYIKPWSSIGLMSAAPPFATAALLIASTASRLSHDRASITSLDVFGGMGRLVKVRHLAWVSSIKFIASLHTMHAEVSSVNKGLFLVTAQVWRAKSGGAETCDQVDGTAGQGREEIPALLARGCEQGPQGGEVPGAVDGAEAAGDLLAQFHHAAVAFRFAVGEGDGGIGKKAQDILLAGG